MNTQNWFLLLLTMAFISSCDVVDAPYTQTQSGSGGGGTGGNNTRTILVEEFTGLKCPNCPAASANLHKLVKDQYEGKVVIVSVHAGNLASPNATYNKDYRTPAGTAMFNDFMMDYVPVALVNRVPVSGSSSPWIDKDLWAAAILSETSKEPEAKLTLTASYNSATRQIALNASGEFLKDATDKENLTLYVIEKEIVGPQDSAHIHIEEYLHKDMLRDVILGTYGERITDTAISAGYTFNKSYNYTLPATIDASKCTIVGFIQNNDTKIVRQATEVWVMP